MSIRKLKGTQVYDFIATNIPMQSEINKIVVQNPYKLSTVKNSMSLLGSMCDYGVRSYFPMRDYAFVELSMVLSGIDQVLDALLSQFCLKANDAYALVKADGLFRRSKLSDAIVNDYDNLVLRSVDLFNCFNLVSPTFGAFYRIGGVVRCFECDCVDERMVLDMKITASDNHIKDYWVQLLTYSMLLTYKEKHPRFVIGLVRPVQGYVEYFKYKHDQYYSIFHRFKELYKEVL